MSHLCIYSNNKSWLNLLSLRVKGTVTSNMLKTLEDFVVPSACKESAPEDHYTRLCHLRDVLPEGNASKIQRKCPWNWRITKKLTKNANFYLDCALLSIAHNWFQGAAKDGTSTQDPKQAGNGWKTSCCHRQAAFQSETCQSLAVLVIGHATSISNVSKAYFLQELYVIKQAMVERTHTKHWKTVPTKPRHLDHLARRVPNQMSDDLEGVLSDTTPLPCDMWIRVKTFFGSPCSWAPQGQQWCTLNAPERVSLRLGWSPTWGPVDLVTHEAANSPIGPSPSRRLPRDARGNRALHLLLYLVLICFNRC